MCNIEGFPFDRTITSPIQSIMIKGVYYLMCNSFILNFDYNINLYDLVDVKNLYFSYYNIDILFDINLNIKENEKFY